MEAEPTPLATDASRVDAAPPGAQPPSMSAIGQRLRLLRERRGYSMREAASRAGISGSFIRMVERGESEIAITRLMRLVDVYGVTVADVLDDARNRPHEGRVALTEARRIEADHGRVVILYLPIAMPGLQPFRFLLAPQARLGGLRHTTHEFFHCIDGTPTLTLGTETFGLSPGDTIHIPPNVDHAWTNATDESCLLVGGVERSADLPT